MEGQLELPFKNEDDNYAVGKDRYPIRSNRRELKGLERGGVPSRRGALDKEFSGFLERQGELTRILDKMFHVKH